MVAFPYTQIDLTHKLHTDIPTWAGTGPEFHHTLEKDHNPDAEYSFKKHEIAMKEGVGTHMDAPAHCDIHGKTIDQIPLEDLHVSCVVIDVSSVAHENYIVSAQDIHNFEEQHGVIDERSLVMIHTGWGQFWNDKEKYRNKLAFPSISAEAAQVLINRNAVGIGVDTLSPDLGENGRYPVHNLFLKSGRYMIENVANLNQMPPTGAFASVSPLSIKGGTEAPARIVGLIPKVQ